MTAPQSNPDDADAGAGLSVLTKEKAPEKMSGHDEDGAGLTRSKARNSVANLKNLADNFEKAKPLKGMTVSTRQLNIPKDLSDDESDTAEIRKKKGPVLPGALHRSVMTVRTLDESLKGSKGTGPCESVHMRKERRRSSFLLNISMHSAPAGPILLPTDNSDPLGSSTPGSSTPPPQQKRASDEFSVRYGSVEIREFPITLGDNPSVSCGPPFTIDWKPQEIYDPVALDEYESSRPPRRSHLQMAIPEAVRKDLLRKTGLTPQQIVSGCRDLNFEKTRRRKSQRLQHLDGFYENVEKARRGVRNSLMPGRKKKERELIREAMDVEKKLVKERSAAWAAEEEILASTMSTSSLCDTEVAEPAAANANAIVAAEEDGDEVE
eukprot:CAMPEP_0113551560 /NCGR_PEP_ID=MMETSP0015_2-20120614/14590_1 /TAXON_ID=2838 /ORGANISM="Odontella" /LENGTH=378 /DNA_ID=CAMNT_0000452461 /DNA_START=214 /DNA_END=1350 /DNA_ORIENTATION=+ /assembly_acc=CAM_ASM_000160